jgi:hypothetical protein
MSRLAFDIRSDHAMYPHRISRILQRRSARKLTLFRAISPAQHPSITTHTTLGRKTAAARTTMIHWPAEMEQSRQPQACPLAMLPRCRGIEISEGKYSGCAFGDGGAAPFTPPCDCPTCNGSGLEHGVRPELQGGITLSGSSPLSGSRGRDPGADETFPIHSDVEGYAQDGGGDHGITSAQWRSCFRVRKRDHVNQSNRFI